MSNKNNSKYEPLQETQVNLKNTDTFNIENLKIVDTSSCPRSDEAGNFHLTLSSKANHNLRASNNYYEYSSSEDEIGIEKVVIEFDRNEALDKKKMFMDFHREFTGWTLLRPKLEFDEEIIFPVIGGYISKRRSFLHSLLEDVKRVLAAMDEANKFKHDLKTDCDHTNVFCKNVPDKWLILMQFWRHSLVVTEGLKDVTLEYIQRCDAMPHTVDKEFLDNYILMLHYALDEFDKFGIRCDGGFKVYKSVCFRFDDYMFLSAYVCMKHYFQPLMENIYNEHNNLTKFELKLRQKYALSN